MVTTMALAPAAWMFSSHSRLSSMLSFGYICAQSGPLPAAATLSNGVLDALLTLATLPQAGMIVNVASGENVSNAVLLECLNRHGFDLSLARQGPGQVMPDCDVNRLRAELGIDPIPVRGWLDAWAQRRRR